MSSILSSRVHEVRLSPTASTTSHVARLRAQGIDVIQLGIGESDFPTPEHIQAAAIAAIRSGHTRYTAIDGIGELKEAIARKFKEQNGIEYALNQIIVSAGAKQSVFNVVMAVVDSGDEVIVPAPYWVSYPEMVRLAGGRPIIVSAGPEQDYKVTPEQLEAAISSRTRLLMLNSPCNPSGATYTRAELRALGDVLERHPHVFVCADDIYEHIYWGDEAFASLLTVCPQLYDQVITVNGVSKAYAMTGWRIGYCGSPAHVTKAMAAIQAHSTSHPTAVSQHAAVTALTGDQTCVRDMRDEFRRRHDFVLDRLRHLPGIVCVPSTGAFYLLPNVQRALQRIGLSTDIEFASYLLERAGILVVAGSHFGAPGHIRICVAQTIPVLREAMARIDALLAPERAAGSAPLSHAVSSA